MQELSKRARAVLYAVVTDFIATGEPVGSRTLTKKYGFDLSPATIRNVLADLEDAGYLAQPHTSAGRVPTPSAFRLFIDALMRVRELSEDDAERIQRLYDELPPGADLLHVTGQLLSDLSGAPALLVRARSEQRTVMKLRFIPTRPGELLSVIVLSDGSVENRFIRIELPVSEAQLERVHNMVEGVVSGRTLSAVREHFARALAEERDELKALSNLGYSLVDAAIGKGDRSKDLVIEGRARFLDQPEFADVERVRELMRALEDREQLVTLLDRTLATEQVQVFLGEETAEAVGFPVSVVAAPYHQREGEPAGAVGIIGPTRMDYPFVVPLVGATARALTEAYDKRHNGGADGDSGT